LQKNYMIFEESMMLSKEYETNLNIANAIRYAIREDQIIPFFQPIIDLKNNRVSKYECLVRLRQDNGEILSPNAFLSISQKLKLYPKITEIMIQKTFEFFQNNGFGFTINLAFDDIFNERTNRYIFNKIDEYGVAGQLTFEILETQQLENDPAVQEFIRKVKATGAEIAIDDFGSGFANFEHMTKIDADYIKIDGSLIKNIDTDLNARLVVETIVVFAKKLGMKTVAEFVHSEQILKYVNALEIDYAQGYYLGKPEMELR
jgi:EAL domain-containing protein (putative c-di-GMP-specific phosphodiesterase class I)